jgi:hypothetical protein
MPVEMDGREKRGLSPFLRGGDLPGGHADMFSARDPADVERFFRGLTEYAFHARLGVVDPPLVDYVAVMLVRFMRNERLAVLPGAGEESADVAHLLLAAERHADADQARAEYRHIGDVTLFWSGLYPEALARHRAARAPADLVGYKAAGKQAYRLVAALEPEDAAAERELFERLSHEYDLCVEGLAEVRRAWGDAA